MSLTSLDIESDDIDFKVRNDADGIIYVTSKLEKINFSYDPAKSKFYEGGMLNDKKNGEGRSYIIRGQN